MEHTELHALIQIKEALLKHCQLLGKTPDPHLRIAAAKEELRLKSEHEELKKRLRIAESRTAPRKKERELVPAG